MLRGFPVIALAAAGALHGSTLPAPEAKPAASVKVVSCSPAHGSAVFYGRMREIERTERMSMRFSLLALGESGRYEPVRAPRLSRWRQSRPGVAAFGYRQRVRGLLEDAVYRARVDFRWHDADGELLRTARRRSRACNQAGPLPNVRVLVTGSDPTATEGVVRYTLRVRNVGGTAAEHVGVRLGVDGSAVDTQTVARLEPREARLLEFRGPPCERWVRAVADPADAVRESSEDDNVHRLTCGQLRLL